MRIRVLLGILAALAAGLSPVQAAPVVIPITMINSHIEIPVTFNGQPTKALLDSGAATSVIDLARARGAALKIEPPGPAISAASARPTGAAGWLMDANGVLSVGGWTSPEPVWVEDLAAMAAMGQSNLIIGDDLFRAFVVELDFEAGTLTLHQRGEFQAPAGAALLRVERADFGYATPVVIEGKAAKLANLDLGANASLMLSQGYAQQLGILGRPGAAAHGCLGLAGEQGCQTGLAVDEVRLGDFVFRDAPVVIAGQGDPIFRNIDANLGLGLLSRFHVWMDLGGGRLWLAPTARMADPYKRTLGCAFRGEGAVLEAVGVVSGGPAARAGLKSGDRIVAVDGVKDRDAMLKAIDAAQVANRKLVFELQDGRRLTVTPGDRV